MRSKNIYYSLLLGIFLTTWIWAAIKPLYFDDWLLENVLIFTLIPLLLLTKKYFEFSLLSYSLITIFAILHVIGSHYTYAEVPWGIPLGHWLGSERNMYDRLVHFLFGLLLVYPVYEIFIRTVKAPVFWNSLVPFVIISALSGIYEVLEWWAASVVNPEAGIAFLGSQGDIWDAQKDMILAKIGAVLTLIFVWLFKKNREDSL